MSTPVTLWDRECPKCKARKNEPCRLPNGNRFTNYLGVPLFHTARSRGEVQA